MVKILLNSILLLSLMLDVANSQDASSINRISMLEIGAKASSLHGAYSAVANDYSATFWNPAAISYINNINLGCMYSQLYLNRNISFISIILPLSYRNKIGISYTSSDITNIEARSENTLKPDNYFDCYDRMVWLTYSFKIAKRLSIGANLKFLQYQLENIRGAGAGFDVGINLKPFENVRLGLVAKDINSNIKWDTGKIESFNQIYCIGIASNIFSNLLIAADIAHVNDEIKWAVGSELRLLNLMKIRSGFQNGQLAVGTGIVLPLMNKKFLLLNYTVKNDDLNINKLNHIFDFNVQLF